MERSASNSEDDLIRDRVNRAIKAIDNALGSTVASEHFLVMPTVLNKIPSTIFGMPWHELKALHRQESLAGGPEMPADKTNYAKRKKQQRNLLGRMSTDLEFLEGLLHEVKLVPPSSPEEKEYSSSSIAKKETDKVSKKTEEAISFLRERQEFWSQFKPMYSK